jgi:hypothetical protein
VKKLIRLPLLLTILIALAIFNIYIAIANKKWYPWLDENKWTGIEAIVSFVLNISIIYITFYIHRKEREERIAELEKQQKQINEQRREADFDRQALMLQNRINLLAEREVKDFDLEKIIHGILLNIISSNDTRYVNIDYYDSISRHNNYFTLQNVSRLFKNTLDLLNDINSFHKESGRQHLHDFLKIHGKFEKFIYNIQTSGFVDTIGDGKTKWSMARSVNFLTVRPKIICTQIYRKKILIDLPQFHSNFAKNCLEEAGYELISIDSSIGSSVEGFNIDCKCRKEYYLDEIEDNNIYSKSFKLLYMSNDGNIFFIAPSDTINEEHDVNNYINRKVSDVMNHEEMKNLLNLLGKTKDDFTNIQDLYRKITESN